MTISLEGCNDLEACEAKSVRLVLASLAGLVHCHSQNVGCGKGVRSQLCEAPVGPFRQLTPDPFTTTTPKLNGDKALGGDCPVGVNDRGTAGQPCDDQDGVRLVVHGRYASWGPPKDEYGLLRGNVVPVGTLARWPWTLLIHIQLADDLRIICESRRDWKLGQASTHQAHGTSSTRDIGTRAIS